LTNMGRHGHTAVELDSKVADGVSWSDFSIPKLPLDYSDTRSDSWEVQC